MVWRGIAHWHAYFIKRPAREGTKEDVRTWASTTEACIQTFAHRYFQMAYDGEEVEGCELSRVVN